jgi:acyl carrier protein
MSDANNQASDVHAAVRTFVVSELLDGDGGGLADDTNLLDAGLINSQALVKLTGFIQSRYGVRVPFKQLTPENLKSIAAIAALIGRVKPV